MPPDFIDYPTEKTCTNTCNGQVAVFERLFVEQIVPFDMALNTSLAILPIFRTFISILFPAMNVHDMFSFYDNSIPFADFLFAVTTNSVLDI